jgi:hypothetical protein
MEVVMSNATDLRGLIEAGREDRAERLAAKRGLTLVFIDPSEERVDEGEFIGYSEDTVFSDQGKYPDNPVYDGAVPSYTNHRHGEWWLKS